MNRHGFTLIELLVVMGLMAILFALSTLEFGKHSSKASVERQVRTLYSDLMTARSQALYEKRNRAVRITGTSFSVYSSDVTTGAPQLTRALHYPLALTNLPDPILFTTRGVIDGIDSAAVCLQNDNEGNIDSLVLGTTRIYTGKKNAGSDCTRANIVIK